MFCPCNGQAYWYSTVGFLRLVTPIIEKMAHSALPTDFSPELMDTDAFDIGLDHNEPAPAVRTKESYEEIMGMAGANNEDSKSATTSLSKRLEAFRVWLENDANVTIHSNLCIVNGEATDGTKNAPVLLYGPPPSVAASQSSANPASGRCGTVDREVDRVLYDRTMGCQVRTAKEIKKGDTLMAIPRTAFVTPDTVACSDAGKAVLACIEPGESDEKVSYWDAFANTSSCEKKFMERISNSGTQLLVKVLQERKRAETAAGKSFKEIDDELIKTGGIAGVGKNKLSLPFTLAKRGVVSTRAVFMAFLIHQRFSNTSQPLVVGKEPEIGEELSGTEKSGLSMSSQITQPKGSPDSFAPYVRTFPSAVSIPLCWKRTELALLSGCIPGVPSLQEVAATTLQIASEFVALVEAGILHRFPSIFPRGMLTWERWMWAASVMLSRVLPVSYYLNDGEKGAFDHSAEDPDLFQSAADVWDETGVMVPLLDMANHEGEAAQIEWEHVVTKSMEAEVRNGDASKRGEAHPPRAIASKRIKKGSQVYLDYGSKNNQAFILQYGIGQVNNSSDEVRLGWGLTDAVGDVKPPGDYESPDAAVGDQNGDAATQTDALGEVFESTDSEIMNSWWSKSRLQLLARDALLSDSLLTTLKSGKKMVRMAFGDGRYHDTLLSASVIGTLPKSRVDRLAAMAKEKEDTKPSFALTKSHQEVLRKYLIFFFTRKMEKLLQSVDKGMKAHFNSAPIWTKLSKGGLQYDGDESQNEDLQGWQSFFDAHAYTATVEVEKRYYSMGPDSCVLTLYDGHLRALQCSLDGLSTGEKFEKGALEQLRQMGFETLDDDTVPEAELAVEVKQEDEKKEVKNGESISDKHAEGNGRGRDRERDRDRDRDRHRDRDKGDRGRDARSRSKRRNKRRGNGNGGGMGFMGDRPLGDRPPPPAIKLHVGNLAYSTHAHDLFEYFVNRYGYKNVLDCHIPTERETGRSRGYGFVTMPEAVSLSALQPGIKHEVHGRILKVAESNSAAANRNRGTYMSGMVPNDRCARCGYRPRYCICQVPDMPPSFNGVGPRHHPEEMRPPEYGDHYPRDPDFDYYGGTYRRDRNRQSYSRSSSRHRGNSRGRRDRDVDRDYRYRRSRSRSFSRGRSRDRDRDRRRDRDRDRLRSRDRSQDRSRDRRRSGRGRFDDRPSRSSRYSHSSRSRSPSSDYSSPRPSRREQRDRRGSDASTSERLSTSRAKSPDQSSPPPKTGGSERKRDGSRKRSRSRSRGRSGRRKRSSKRESSKKHARSRSRSQTG